MPWAPQVITTEPLGPMISPLPAAPGLTVSRIAIILARTYYRFIPATSALILAAGRLYMGARDPANVEALRTSESDQDLPAAQGTSKIDYACDRQTFC